MQDINSLPSAIRKKEIYPKLSLADKISLETTYPHLSREIYDSLTKKEIDFLTRFLTDMVLVTKEGEEFLRHFFPSFPFSIIKRRILPKELVQILIGSLFHSPKNNVDWNVIYSFMMEDPSIAQRMRIQGNKIFVEKYNSYVRIMILNNNQFEFLIQERLFPDTTAPFPGEYTNTELVELLRQSEKYNFL